MGSINAPGFSSSHSRSIDDASNSGARIAKANELDMYVVSTVLIPLRH